MIGWIPLHALQLPDGAGRRGSGGIVHGEGTTTTWVPLIDSGLDDRAGERGECDTGPVTTYTYDPSGTPSVTGTANDWPFLYDGTENEFTDPASLVLQRLGQFYGPLIMRELAQVDATGLGQPNLGGSSGGGSKGTGGASRRGNR